MGGLHRRGLAMEEYTRVVKESISIKFSALPRSFPKRGKRFTGKGSSSEKTLREATTADLSMSRKRPAISHPKETRFLRRLLEKRIRKKRKRRLNYFKKRRGGIPLWRELEKKTRERQTISRGMSRRTTKREKGKMKCSPMEKEEGSNIFS